MDKKGMRVVYALSYFIVILIITIIFKLGLLFYFLLLFPASIFVSIRVFKMAQAIKNNVEYKVKLQGVLWMSHISHPKGYRAVMYSLFISSIIFFLLSLIFLYLFIKSVL